MRTAEDKTGKELEEWFRKRADDLEMYRESGHKIEYENTLERMEETAKRVLEK